MQTPAHAPAFGRPALRWTLLIVGVLAAILAPFLLLEARIEGWTADAFRAASDAPGLIGALIVALLAGDVVLPVPSSIVSTFAGAALGWKVAAGVIWLGMTLGCLAGYWLGASAGRGLARRVVGDAELQRANRLFDRVGPLALVVTRAVPVLAEAGTLAAGAARMPLLPFTLSTAVANIGVALAYAGVGSFAASSGSFLIAFLGLVCVPALAWTIWRIVARPTPSRPE